MELFWSLHGGTLNRPGLTWWSTSFFVLRGWAIWVDRKRKELWGGLCNPQLDQLTPDQADLNYQLKSPFLSGASARSWSWISFLWGRELRTTPAAIQVTATPQGPVLLHSHFFTAEIPGNKKAKMQLDMIDLISLLLVLTCVYDRGTVFSKYLLGSPRKPW